VGNGTAPQHDGNFPDADIERVRPALGSALARFVRSDFFGTLALLLVLVAYRWEAFHRISTSYLGGSERDAGLYVWLSHLISQRIGDMVSGAVPWSVSYLVNTPAFYPYRGSLAWSDNFLLPGFVMYLGTRAGIGSIFVYNSTLLSASFLNGWCTRWCARVYGASALPALTAGIGVMTLPYLTVHLGHPQLQFFFWIPTGAACLRMLLDRPGFRNALHVGLSVAGAFLTSVYFAVFLVLACLVLAVPYLHRGLLRRGMGIGCGALCAAAVVAPLVPSYLHTQDVFGARRLHEFFFFSANPWSYLSAPSLVRMPYQVTAAWSRSEALLFPGIALAAAILWGYGALRERMGERFSTVVGTILVGCLVLTAPSFEKPASVWLAGAGWILLSMSAIVLLSIRRAPAEQRAAPAFLSLALLCFCISLGPLVIESGRGTLPGPFVAFLELFPGFSGVRAIGRIGLVAVFAALVAFSLRIGERHPRTADLWCLLLITLSLFENRTNGYALDDPTPEPTIVERVPKTDAAAVFLPFSNLHEDASIKWGRTAEFTMNYLNWALDARIALVNGYSGQRTKLFEELAPLLRDFPSQLSIDALRGIHGVRYVVVIARYLPPPLLERTRSTLSEFPNELRLVDSDREGNLLIELLPGRIRLRRTIPLIFPAECTSVRAVLELDGEPSTGEHIEAVVDRGSAGRPRSVSKIETDGRRSIEWRFALPETGTVRPHRILFRGKPVSDGMLNIEEVTCAPG
jgi:hypothetical protein